MARGTIGFEVHLTNRNLAGFARQVAFVQALPPTEGLPRMSSETRRIRVHFAGKESIGVESLDLYFSQWEWDHLIAESNAMSDMTMLGPD